MHDEPESKGRIFRFTPATLPVRGVDCSSLWCDTVMMSSRLSDQKQLPLSALSKYIRDEEQ